MRVPGNLRRPGVGFNMTPMIDVVFLLIIFFLVSSHLSRQEFEKIDLPDAGTGQPLQQDETRCMVVNVLPGEQQAGRILVAGRAVAGGELAGMIEYESRSGGAPLEVRIRCDRQVPYQVVEPVMIACARAGVWKVTFAVVGK